MGVEGSTSRAMGSMAMGAAATMAWRGSAREGVLQLLLLLQLLRLLQLLLLACRRPSSLNFRPRSLGGGCLRIFTTRCCLIRVRAGVRVGWAACCRLGARCCLCSCASASAV